MRRQCWFEIHDQAWFPKFLRDLVTEGLQRMWASNRTYHPIAARLRAALERTDVERVVDLCSGGGGPWLALYDEVAGGRPLEVCLTDLFPNELTIGADALRGSSGGRAVRVWAAPVDARRVPPELGEFRTIFSSFHHFDPEAARAMLADAFERRQGIAVFEAARPQWRTVLAVTAVPFLAFVNAVRARPARAKRIFWSCVVPVVPAILWIDGVLSCLRSYSLEDMRELTEGLWAADYGWEIGLERGGPVAIQFLIGAPLR
jgi:hypothetical protein